MGDVERPSWWKYPLECAYGHAWGPGRVIVSWLPCGCAGGDGHLLVSCAEPECAAVWYQPPHQSGVDVRRYRHRQVKRPASRSG
jgi:hypothetical protein